MLYTQTVDPRTLDIIRRLAADELLKDFNLVGGAALSLKLGHRISVDIDLFINSDFNSQEIAEHLKQEYHATNVKTLKNGIFCFIENIKVDLIAHQYQLLNKVETIDGVRMVSLQDIGAMKLNAILFTGSRLKDFVDMHFLLENLSLKNLTQGFVQKYPDVNG